MTAPTNTPPAPLSIWIAEWDTRPDSPNVTRGLHWSHRAKRAKKAKQYVFAAVARQRRREVPGQVVITVTRHMGPRQRALDYDNAVAACKPLIDALVHWNVIGGDTEKHVASVIPRFMRAKRAIGSDEFEVGTHVLIQPVPPA